MILQQIVTSSGNSAAVQARRDCALVLYSANWASETANLEVSDNNTEWQAAKDDAGSAIAATGNEVFRVAGGFYYRINKSGAVASIRMTIRETLAASEK